MSGKFKIGSLFDGSGGFPLAARLCGGVPTWASDVEPYPIAVTRSRFPGMKHLGSVTDINGGEIEPVDIITFGSPCQDLSVAGKRAGLKHEANGDDETTRSGLFMEAVRIIKEMREATNGRYPTFALWENVPGAFSSNKGEDFRTVCEELIKIVEPGAVMPAIPQKGWAYADSYCGDGWSLAYRVFDAQFWGVPQRRRRIHLVLDLRGERARKVGFEREGLRWNTAKNGATWQIASNGADLCVGETNAENERIIFNCIPIHDKATRYRGGGSTRKGDGAGNGLGIGKPGDPAPTLLTGDRHMVSYCYAIQGSMIGRADKNEPQGDGVNDEVSFTLNTIDRHAVAYGVDCRNLKEHQELYPTLQAKPNGGWSLNFTGAVRYFDRVRRLTPTEWARLQGFPDTWGHPDRKENFTDEEYRFWMDVRNTHAAINGKPTKEYTRQQMLNWYNKLHTDSAEYKMWGNGIALPPALYCMQGMAEALEAEE